MYNFFCKDREVTFYLLHRSTFVKPDLILFKLVHVVSVLNNVRSKNGTMADLSSWTQLYLSFPAILQSVGKCKHFAINNQSQ